MTKNFRETAVPPTLTAFAKLRQALNEHGIKLEAVDFTFDTPPPTPEKPSSAYFVIGVYVPVTVSEVASNEANAS